MDLDQAAGLAWVVWLERGDLGVRLEHVEEPPRHALVQRTNGGLVFTYRVAIRAVAQAERQRAAGLCLQGWLKAQRRQRVPERLDGARPIGRGQLTTDLAPAGLETARCRASRSHGPGEPAAEVAVGAGRLASRAGIGRDRPDVGRTSAGLAGTRARGVPPARVARGGSVLRLGEAQAAALAPPCRRGASTPQAARTGAPALSVRVRPPGGVSLKVEHASQLCTAAL